MMEILNAVWTSLITENEGVVNILSIPLTFLEIFVSMELFIQILNISCNKRQKILYVILSSTFSCITNLFIPRPYTVYINMITYPIFIYFIFKITVIKSILSEIMPLIIIALFETFIIKIYSVTLNLSYDAMLSIPIHRISPVLIIYLIIFAISFICRKLNLNINIFDNLTSKSKIIILVDLVFGIISIALQFYLIVFYIQNISIYISIFTTLTLLIYFFISFYALSKVSSLESTKQNLEEAKLYNKTLQLLHDNVRAFRHDFSNIIAGIGGYVQTKDMEGLEKYYSQLLVDCQCTNNLTTLSPTLINNPAIYNVLANKYHKADEKGIKIELSIFYDFNKLNIKIYELTRILGILLDNAIEASGDCDKKFINLVIRDEAKYHRQVVLIENTYTNKEVNTDEIFEKGFSTKQGNTGLGLWQVRQMLKKNNNLNLFTSKNEEYFIQSLEIYNNK